jgi:NitT/TauT family transport system permease protein
MKQQRTQRNLLLSVVSITTILIAWLVVTNTGLVSEKILPSPQSIVREVLDLLAIGYTGTSLWSHIGASLVRTLTGLAAAIVVGIPIGLLVGRNQVIAALLNPVFSFLRPVPAIAFIPLIILYFGIGQFSKIMLIFVTATLYIVLNAAAGARAVSDEQIRAGLNMGLSGRQLFIYIILPASAPYLVAGVKTATALSWALVVAAEMIAGQEGLGYMVMDASTFYRISDVYIAIAIIGLIGLALEIVETVAENRFIHWRGR